MHHTGYRLWFATALAGALFTARGASGQEPPPAPIEEPPAPPAPPPPPATQAPPSDEVKDGFRLRGGFSLNGGVMLLPNATPGPAFGLGARIGMQFNHYLGLVYQNTPIVTLTAQEAGSGSTSSAGLKAGFADYNSLMLMLTFFHALDIGAGPSLDFLAVANASISQNGTMTDSSSGVVPGGHGRVAFNIGGLSGNGPRRSGFAIGVDAHPLFTGPGRGLSLTAGIGAEWY